MVHTFTSSPDNSVNGEAPYPTHFTGKQTEYERGEGIAQGVMLAYLLSNSGGSELPLCLCLF